MSLATGTKLGPYEILAAIGAGGMGEVYRARDTKLDREVAIKILPELFKADPERIARFTREAKTLAALNHPHIAQIHGLEESDGLTALVMELVEGATLDERIARGPIPLAEALPIAQQIAEALEAAHEHGIIHRDLKPANIKVRDDGMVKVLDFGLAKALDPVASVVEAAALTQSPTITSPAAMTHQGVILGTAAYMAPEQARGKAVDKRADIWAFGCVLYELLAGRRAFDDEDVSLTLSRVLQREPDWNLLPTGAPPAILRLLRRCLVKDRARRLADIADARFELEEAAGLPVIDSSPTRGVVTPTARWRRALPWTVATISLVTLVVMSVGYLATTPENGSAYRAVIPIPLGLRFVDVPPRRFALSPDGHSLAFVATDVERKTRLWIHKLDAATSQALSGTDGATAPFWSPDSRHVGFSAEGKLKKVDTSGGPPLTLADASNVSGSWNRDGVVLFGGGPGAAIGRVPASGGVATPATTLDAERGHDRHLWPYFLPDGRHFLYYAVGSKTGGSNEPNGIYVGALDSTEQKLLVPGGSNAQYASGYLFFLREQVLVAQTFDADRLELVGAPMPLAEDVAIGGGSGQVGAFSVSDGGVLAFQAGAGDVRSQLVWFDRTGRQTGALGDIGISNNVELSPDNKWAAINVLDSTRRKRDLWLFDVARGLATRFTSEPGDELVLRWTTDGSRMVFNSRRKGYLDLYQRAAADPASEELLLTNELNKYPVDWSADGRFLMYVVGPTGSDLDADIWVLPLFGDRRPFPFLQSQFFEDAATLSPDARWVAYASNESGRNEVYVTAFPKPGPKWRISTTGGGSPRWRDDGKELFYLTSDNRLVAVEVNGVGSTINVGKVQPLFQTRAKTGRYEYDASADGQRFIVNTVVEDSAATSVTLVVNWPALLKP